MAKTLDKHLELTQIALSDTFTGEGLPTMWGRLFGGQVLSQSLLAASKTVDENIVSIIAKIGEKITIGRSKTISHKDSENFTYLHTVVKDNLSKLAVIISLQTKENSDNIHSFGEQLAMHVAAQAPIAIDEKGINKDVLDKELEIIK